MPPRETQTSVPAGNSFDKYGTHNVIFRWLVRQFTVTMMQMIEQANPQSILDVGCGEGVLTEEMASRFPRSRVVGVDLVDSKLRSEWAQRTRSNLEFHISSAHDLPYRTTSFDMVVGMEVLEHLFDPQAALFEMRRVAARWLLLSVPNEPLWRILNMARGAYLRDLGNTPGHVNHWSRNSFVKAVRRYGDVRAVRSPLPWTVVLAHPVPLGGLESERQSL
jgi:SAM-dependent methyltransferase